MNTWIISGIILASGLIICSFLFLRSKWLVRKRNIKEYEEARDKLTYRKKKEEPIEEDATGYGGFSITSLIGGFIAMIIGLTLLPVISKQVNLALNTTVVNTNQTLIESTPWASTVLGIVPIFFAIAIVTIAVGVVYSNLRGNGFV